MFNWIMLMTLHAMELQIIKSLVLRRNLSDVGDSPIKDIKKYRLDNMNYQKLSKEDTFHPNLLKTKTKHQLEEIEDENIT